MPRAMSRPSEPVEMTSLSVAASREPSFMIEPLPNARSIWPRAASRAFCLSIVSLSNNRNAVCDIPRPPYSMAAERLQSAATRKPSYQFCSRPQVLFLFAKISHDSPAAGRGGSPTERATKRLRFSTRPAISFGNQGVAHDRSHRKDHRDQGVGVARVARAHRSSRIRDVVPRPAGRAVRAGTGVARPDHLSRLRAYPLGGGHPEDRAGAAVLVHLAPLRDRSQDGLFRRAADADRVHLGEDRDRDVAAR